MKSIIKKIKYTELSKEERLMKRLIDYLYINFTENKNKTIEKTEVLELLLKFTKGLEFFRQDPLRQELKND